MLHTQGLQPCQGPSQLSYTRSESKLRKHCIVLHGHLFGCIRRDLLLLLHAFKHSTVLVLTLKAIQ
jgi:hypothetical protein